MKVLKQLVILFIIFTNCENAQKSLDVPTEQHSNKTLSDSLRLETINNSLKKRKSMPIDTFELHLIANKSDIYYEMGKIDSVFFYDQLLLKKAQRINNGKYLAKAHLNVAYYFDDLEVYDSAFYHYNQSKNYSQKFNDSVPIGKCLVNMGIIQQDQNDFFGSKETLTEALQYYKNNKFIASVYNELATNHKSLLNYTDAISYYKKAIQTTPVEENKLIYKNNLATAYIENENYKPATIILNEIIYDSLLHINRSEYARVLDNLTYAQWQDNKPINVSLFYQALKIRKKENDKRGLLASYNNLAEYFLQKNPYEATKYLDTLIQLSKQLKIPRAETDALKLLMDIQPNNRAFKDRYIMLKDSLYNQELKAKTQFAKMKYDDETNQKAILKLEAEKVIQSLEVAKQHTQKIIYLVSGIVLLIVGGLLFYIIKQRYVKEKLKEIYSTETRISKKVHDELANDMYNVINKIQDKTDNQQNDVLNQLENIYKRTRDISYEHSAINLDNDYYDLELKDMISSYQNHDTKISTIGLNKAVFESISNLKKIETERVLKELMTNMKKHSKATNVVLTFKKEKRHIQITYMDDGVGFSKTPHFKNNGLQNAENRIKNINGSFNFDFNRKKGVSLTISFPA